MIMSELNLHRLVIETAREFPAIADPGELAAIVFERIGSADYGTALRQTLRGFVRVAVNNSQRSAPERPEQEPVTAGVRRSSRSRFVSALQGGVWRQRLEDRELGADGWKLLGDFTADDCRAACALHEEQAVTNARRAERFPTVLCGGSSKTVTDRLPAGHAARDTQSRDACRTRLHISFRRATLRATPTTGPPA